MQQIRLGVVGFGRRGRSLFGLSASLDGIIPAAVCDADSAHLKSVGETYPGAECFTDFDEMLARAQLDALLVETPATFHTEFCIKALEKNINVMSDVPAVAKAEEAWQLWRAQEKSRAFYMMGANPNMWGFVDTAAKLVKDGALGEPYYMEAEYIHDLRDLFDRTPWRQTYESVRYCTHSLGPLLRLIEEDLEWTSCLDAGSHINRQEGQHDAMVAIFRTRANVVVRFLTSFINCYPAAVHGYRVYGTKGYFERKPACEGEGPAKTLYYSSIHHAEKALHEIPVGEAPEQGSAVGEHGGADHMLLRRFFNAIRQRLPSPVSLREALRMTLPGLAAAESARKGGELVHINYPWTTDNGA